MKIVVIDADYNYNRKNDPVIRLFGKNIENDEDVCVHVLGFEPYMYVGVPEQYTVNDFYNIIIDKFKGFYDRVQIVKRYKPIGYQIDKVDVLKIVVNNPKVVPDIKRMLVDEIDYMDSSLVYEADILFRDRFMINMGIDGMSIIVFNETGKELNNYGLGCSNIYIISLNEFKVLNENVAIDY